MEEYQAAPPRDRGRTARKPVFLVNIGTRADEILTILNSIIGSRYHLGEAVVYLMSPRSSPFFNTELLKEAAETREEAKELHDSLEHFLESLRRMKDNGFIQDLVHVDKLTLFQNEPVASHHIFSRRYLKRLLTEILVRAINISRSTGSEVDLYIPLPGWPHTAYPVLEHFDNFFGGGYRGVRTHRVDLTLFRFRDPRNGARKWAWEIDEVLKGAAELQRELREEMYVREYGHLVEIMWEQPWSRGEEGSICAYAIVAALHEAAREHCREGEPCEIYYQGLFEHLVKGRDFYSRICGGSIPSLRKEQQKDLWLSLREWLEKTRLVPILGEFIESGIRLSGLGAELCGWVYEVEEKLLSQARGTTPLP